MKKFFECAPGARLGSLSVLALLAMAACGSPDEPETSQADPAPAETAASSEEVAQSAEPAEAEHTTSPQNPGAVYKAGTDFVIGYSDSPYLPDGKWKVHDPDRPRPDVVTPQKGVFTPPPSDAVVLFDGSSFDNFVNINAGAPEWVVENGTLRVPSDIPHDVSADIQSRQSFGDQQLHIEWRTPSEVISGSQGRGNSGVFLMGRYEVQVLDSYQNETYADGQASAIYGWKPPLKNATLPPGEWQSYDIIFEAPKFDTAGNLLSPAFVTVFHNGVLTQYRENYLGLSGHRNILPYEAHGPGPLKLQDHGNPVEFRNIWVRELDLAAND